MNIRKFKVEQKHEKIYFGERVKISWELELDAGERTKRGTEELAVIYPYGWKVKEEVGSIIFPVYENMDVWMRTKDDKGIGIDSEHYSLHVVDAKAEIELCITISKPAYIEVTYKNASYGFLSQGVGRVEGKCKEIKQGGEYEFTTPYMYQNEVKYEKSTFHYNLLC